jgi:hypothetical protein
MSLSAKDDDAEGLVEILAPGLTKETRRAGSGNLPCLPCGVAVHYVSMLVDGGSIVDSSRRFMDAGFCFNLGGSGATHHESEIPVTRGLAKAVAGMLVGETALVTCGPEWAYGDVGVPFESGTGLRVPPGASMKYNVEVLRFLPYKKASSEMSLSDAMEAARAAKVLGDAAIKAGLQRGGKGGGADERASSGKVGGAGDEEGGAGSTGGAGSETRGGGADEKNSSNTSGIGRNASVAGGVDGAGGTDVDGSSGSGATDSKCDVAADDASAASNVAASADVGGDGSKDGGSNAKVALHRAKKQREEQHKRIEDAYRDAHQCLDVVQRLGKAGGPSATDAIVEGIQMRVSCLSNFALWQLRRSGGAAESAVHDSGRALEILDELERRGPAGLDEWVPNARAKLLYRRGMAHQAMERPGPAKADLLRAAKMQPQDKTIRKALQRATQELKVTNAAARGMYSNVLDKSAKSGKGLYGDKEDVPEKKPELRGEEAWWRRARGAIAEMCGCGKAKAE